MKYFGADRVVEPAGAIPSMAWKLDNSKTIGPAEARIALRAIKLEGNNFNQICSSCQYNETKIAERITDIAAKRGKLQNPYTQSSGVLYGVVDQVGRGWNGEPLQKGDPVVSLTSTAGFPVFIESISKIDFNYGMIWCEGYAIVFESAKLARMPENISAGPFLCAIDAEGSLVDLRDALVERLPEKIGIMGSNLVDMMLYAQMVRVAERTVGVHSRIVAVVEKCSLSYINEKEFLKVFSGVIDMVYFADMARPIESAEKILKAEGGIQADAVINLEDIRGAESAGALMVRDMGFLFHAGVKGNYFQSLIAADCLGKEITSYALDGYSKDACELAVRIVRESEKNFRDLDRLLASKASKNMIKHVAMTQSRAGAAKRIEDFVFMSPVTGEVVETALNVAKFDCNVIIQGETGTGKERVMDLIHQNSSRRGKPCVKINCATIQENLAESEFFGYEKGAFTGAQAGGKQGYFELANNGTLFLDEIGSLPLSMQSKLLRVLQENSFYRVGGTELKTVNVRVICANNVPLKKLVDEGSFREDLYYRLNICLIEVPPLRKRPEDIVCLAEAFIKKYSQKYGVEKTFSQEGFDALCRYHWPGNVRELENTVHRLYITAREEEIDGQQVDDLLNDSFYDDLVIDLKKELRGMEVIDFNQIMDEQEKKLIAYALKKEKTTRKAAEFLKIPQPTLARKKVKYGL